MKTPISYYGGKQNLISELLKLIPPHKQYVEPFVGGASLFFAKPPSDHEVINDFNLQVVNFWEVLQSDFDRLQAKIKSTLHSEAQYIKAKKILKADIVDPVDFAWAFYVQCHLSFSKKIYGGFTFSKDGNGGGSPQTTKNVIDEFDITRFARVRDCEIFNRDAIDIITMKDNEETFFYLDPPYAESNCGHYEKGKDVYYRLLDILPTIKGKWLMSSYPSEQLTALRLANGWNHKDIDKNLSVSGKHNKGKRKTECLTWNYELESQQGKLFAA